MSRPTPALEALVRTYFHQDYDLIGSIESNVDRFVTDFPQLAPALPSEVAEVVRVHTDVELEGLLDEFGCELNPPDDLTYRAWLTQIADRVRAATT